MAKRGENIRRRKDGRWEGRYKKDMIDGKAVQGSVYGKTYQEVKEKLLYAKINQAGGSKKREERQDEALNASFATVAEEWFEAIRPTLKPSSISKYRNVLDIHLLPEFGAKKLTDITRNEVTAFSSRLLASGGRKGCGLAPKSVSDILSVMKNAMGYAHHVKCVRVIDFEGITIRQPKKQFRVFSRAEQRAFSKYLIDNLTPITMGILVCLYTGLRVGEICALTWGDISFSEQKLHVARTMQRIQLPKESEQRTRVIITEPKSDYSVRDIPIPDEVFRLLADRRKPDGCFFLTGLERTFIEPRTLENHFHTAAAACGISGATMHTCRHTFATRCIELGFDIKTLSEILGHANVAITMNRYVHPSMEMKQQSMNRLSNLLEVK